MIVNGIVCFRPAIVVLKLEEQKQTVRYRPRAVNAAILNYVTLIVLEFQLRLISSAACASHLGMIHC